MNVANSTRAPRSHRRTLKRLRNRASAARDHARRARERASAASDATLTACAHTRWGGNHVLVVDDDRDNKDAMAALLDAEGYDVKTAVDGQEAIERLRRGEDPSVIVLDYRMPRMDGLAFRTAQADDPKLAPIPVVVCSAEAAPAERVRELSVRDWLRKPVDPDVLVRTVRRYARPRRHR